MRNYDFTPLYRSTVGFDRLASMLDIALTADAGTNTYPHITLKKLVKTNTELRLLFLALAKMN